MVRVMQEKSINDMHNEFHRIYHSKIKSLMEEFEKKRIVELLKFVLVALAAIIIIYVCFKQCQVNFSESAMLIGLSAPVVAAYFLYNIQNNFSKELKKRCLPKIVKAFGNMKWFNGKQELDSDDIFKSELFSEFNRREDDDAFVGVYKDVDFTISETVLWYVSSGRNKIVYKVFNGVIVNFSSNKNIKNKTIIATKNDIHIKGRQWGIWLAVLMMLPALSPMIVGGYTLEDVWYVGSLVFITLTCLLILFFSNRGKEKLNEIKLEDAEFNKHYKAFSSDEVEGRYLITTSFMERFKNLQTAFGAQKAKCSFYDSDIMFAISTRRNLFEIGNIFTPLTNPKHLTRFYNELSSILTLIDYFKLDEKTGL